MAKDATTNQLYVRSALVGAGLGLYFGLFFTPLRQPSIAFTLLLAFSVTVVLVCIQAIRNRPSPGALLKGALSTFVKVALLLFLLDGRHLAYALGGKVLVTIYTTIGGIIAGLWYAWDQSRDKSGKDKEQST